jgi:hypothetical protein
MVYLEGKQDSAASRSGAHAKTPLHPGSILLRRAVRRNIVCFPSQVPVFLKQREAGMQWRAVLLFFVRGWSSPRIAARFRVPTHTIWQILEDWSVRAWALGYIQVLDPEAFARCCRIQAPEGMKQFAAGDRAAQVRPAAWSVPRALPDLARAAAGAGGS